MAQKPMHSKLAYYYVVGASFRTRDVLIDAKSAIVVAVGWLNLAQSRSTPPAPYTPSPFHTVSTISPVRSALVWN